jgi:hypothetical protein
MRNQDKRVMQPPAVGITIARIGGGSVESTFDTGRWRGHVDGIYEAAGPAASRQVLPCRAYWMSLKGQGELSDLCSSTLLRAALSYLALEANGPFVGTAIQ